MNLVEQRSSIDCGIAALSMILNNFKYFVPFQVLKEKFKLSDNGASIYEIQRIAKEYNVNSEALRGTTDEFVDSVETNVIKTPCIVRISNSDGLPHYVVAEKVSAKKGITVCDPAGYKYLLKKEEFDSVFLGEVITFEKAGNFKEKKKSNPFFFYIKTTIEKPRNILSIVLIMILTGIVTGVSLIPSFVMKVITDEMSGDHEILEQIAVMITFSAVSLFIGHFSRILQSKLTIGLSTKMLESQFKDAYCGLIQRPLNFFCKTATGDIQERFLDSIKISNTVLQMLFSCFNFVMMLFSGAIIFKISSNMFFVSIGVAAVSIIEALVFKKALVESSREISVTSAKSTDLLRESSEGILTIKAANGENQLKNKFLDSVNSMKQAIKKSAIKSVRKDSICDVIQGIGLMVLLWIGVVEISDGHLTIGSLVVLNTVYFYFLSPVNGFIELYDEILEATVEAERLNEITNCENEPVIYNENVNNDIKGSILVKNVSFGYTADNIIDDLTVQFEAKKCIAITGNSGKGKSTLAKLIAGIEKPIEGSILLDDMDISTLTQEKRTDLIQYIPQQPYFFNGTYRENLVLGLKNAVTDEEIYELLSKLNADFVTNLDGLICENGDNLSGGQKQKLAIARSLLRKNVKVLIMDESTSSIDVKSQEKIFDLIRSFDFTIIIISHDTSVINMCDKQIAVY